MAAMAFREFQLGVIADRRRRAAATTSSASSCHAEIEGERLDDESIVQETLLILIGGDETTRHVITGGMLALMDHPGERDRAARRPRRRDAHRRRGAAALGHADQEHVAHASLATSRSAASSSTRATS